MLPSHAPECKPESILGIARAAIRRSCTLNECEKMILATVDQLSLMAFSQNNAAAQYLLLPAADQCSISLCFEAESPISW